MNRSSFESFDDLRSVKSNCVRTQYGVSIRDGERFDVSEQLQGKCSSEDMRSGRLLTTQPSENTVYRSCPEDELVESKDSVSTGFGLKTEHRWPKNIQKLIMQKRSTTVTSSDASSRSNQTQFEPSDSCAHEEKSVADILSAPNARISTSDVVFKESEEGSNSYTKKRKYRKREPKKNKVSAESNGKPRRPLSAYNFFFREERNRIITGEVPGADNLKREVKSRIPATSSLDDSFNHLQRGDSPHYKITFEKLGQTIATRWNNLPESARAKYKDMAKKDSLRYREEMEGYYENENAKQRTMLEAAQMVDTLKPSDQGRFVASASVSLGSEKTLAKSHYPTNLVGIHVKGTCSTAVPGNHAKKMESEHPSQSSTDTKLANKPNDKFQNDGSQSTDTALLQVMQQIGRQLNSLDPSALNYLTTKLLQDLESHKQQVSKFPTLGQNTENQDLINREGMYSNHSSLPMQNIVNPLSFATGAAYNGSEIYSRMFSDSSRNTHSQPFNLMDLLAHQSASQHNTSSNAFSSAQMFNSNNSSAQIPPGYWGIQNAQQLPSFSITPPAFTNSNLK